MTLAPRAVKCVRKALKVVVRSNTPLYARGGVEVFCEPLPKGVWSCNAVASRPSSVSACWGAALGGAEDCKLAKTGQWSPRLLTRSAP